MTNITENSDLLQILKEYSNKEKKKKVDTIFLNNNELERIVESDLEIFVNFCYKRTLKKLILCNNQISYFEITPILKNLTKLDLSSNRLTKVPAKIELLANLTSLHLEKNRIKELPYLSKLIYLKYLDVSENLIHTLHKSLASCISLKKVNIEFNPIIDPPSDICSRGWKQILQFWKSDSKIENQRISVKLEKMIDTVSFNDDDLNKEAVLTLVLSSNEGVEQLRLFLRTVYAEENLDFLQKVKEYEKTFSVIKPCLTPPLNKSSFLRSSVQLAPVPPIRRNSIESNQDLLSLNFTSKVPSITIKQHKNKILSSSSPSVESEEGGEREEGSFLINEESISKSLEVSPLSRGKSSTNILRTKELANHLFSEFIDTESEHNVNLPHEIVEKIKEDLKKGNILSNLFDEAYRHVFNMLAVDKMIPFKKSEFYSKFLSSHKRDIFNHMHFKKRYSHGNQQRFQHPKISPRLSQPPVQPHNIRPNTNHK